MPEVPLYSMEGATIGTVELADALFGAPVRPDLMHQAVVALLANRRAGTAHTKRRGEVRGGGRKPWRQKGTGHARHGSGRSPLWVGGGVIHGPRARRWRKGLPRKMRRQALASAWSMHLAEGRLKVVDSLQLPGVKTKQAQAALAHLFPEPGDGRLLIMLAEEEREVERAFRNLPRVRSLPAPHATIYDLVLSDRVLLTEKAARRLEREFLGAQEVAAEEAES